MTAIFAVWNNYGFSLASDSNQTGSKDNQTWVDPVEKIIMLENHQISIGAAGNSFHSGVEVNEIFRSWEKSMPKEGFNKLDDYFVNFAFWFSSQTFNESAPDFEGLGTLFKSCFEDISKVLADNEHESDLSDLENRVIALYERDRDTLNFLGPDWETYASVSDSLSEIFTVSGKKADDLRNSLKLLSPEIESFNFLFNSQDELDPRILEQVYPAFKEIFGKDLNFDSELDLEILNISVSLISNLSSSSAENLEVLLIGFGVQDWLPSGISFKLYSSFFGLHRLCVTDWSSPNVNWFMSIAIDAAIQELTRGISVDRLSEITELASAFIEPSRLEEFTEKISEQSTEKFHKTLSRIDYLTIDRLEFVSRLFVQIEALKSFLDQPVPGVGGDTKVISMTKTTRRQKYFREFE
jgi:hypothetical protein